MISSIEYVIWMFDTLSNASVLWSIQLWSCSKVVKVRQNCEKWGKTGISKRVIKALFVNVYGKFQFSISQNNVNFVVGGLKHKPGIFTIYAWLSVWLHCAVQWGLNYIHQISFLRSLSVHWILPRLNYDNPKWDVAYL